MIWRMRMDSSHRSTAGTSSSFLWGCFALPWHRQHRHRAIFAGVFAITQKEAYKTLLDNAPIFPFATFVFNRLARHLPDTMYSTHIPRLLDIYKTSSQKIGYAPALTHLRAIGNHWCTYSRFGIKRHTCLFGCGFESDRIAHTLFCHHFLLVFFEACGLVAPVLTLENAFLLTGEWFESSHDHACFGLLASHLCFLCFNACKHGMAFNRRLVIHKLADYCRNHLLAAKFIKSFRRKAYHTNHRI